MARASASSIRKLAVQSRRVLIRREFTAWQTRSFVTESADAARTGVLVSPAESVRGAHSGDLRSIVRASGCVPGRTVGPGVGLPLCSPLASEARRTDPGLAATRPLAAHFHSSSNQRLGAPQESESEGDTSDASAEQRSPPTERVQRLVDEIADLTLLEVADLTSLLKKKLGLPDVPMGGGMMMAMGPGMMAPGMGGAPGATEAASAEPVKEEKTSFDVMLQKFDAASKLKVIKEVRAITGLGLKESKELVESAPATIKKGVPKDEADSIAGKLSAVGAEVTLD